MKIKNKKIKLFEAISIIIFSSVVSLGFILLLKLVVVNQTSVHYNIETDMLATSQVLTEKVKKSKRVSLISDVQFLDSTKLEKNWSYIGREDSGIIGTDNVNYNNIVYYEYANLTKTHRKITLAKAEKNVNYELKFIKKSSSNEKNILKFVILGYVDSNNNEPKQKTETAVEGLNVIEVANENLNDFRIAEDLDGNFIANSIKFSSY